LVWLDGISVRAHLGTFNTQLLCTYYFSARSPTSASSERAVAKASGSEPWKESGGSGPYQYHPGGDTSVKKDAPSALNVVVIPNVTLPKVWLLAVQPCAASTHSVTGAPRHLQQVGQGRILRVSFCPPFGLSSKIASRSLWNSLFFVDMRLYIPVEHSMMNRINHTNFEHVHSMTYCSPHY
jgi:hypothetical protein